MKKLVILAAVGLLLTSCGRDKSAADAYGNFEANEIIVSAEANGKLMAFQLQEGDSLRAGTVVGLIDTTILALQRNELNAQRGVMNAQIKAAGAQISMARQKLENTQRDLQRVRNMVQDDAATQKQLDDLEAGEKVMQKQVDAARAQRDAAAAQLSALEAKAALLDEQLSRCRVVNPIDGVVLEKYIEAFELTAAGRPLYKIADLQNMVLTVYVAGGDLHDLTIGADCTVRIDDGKDYITLPGRVSWISSEAEFTPKIIQTKKERIDLVYAVKVLVDNDGAAKIGMPGEVIFDKKSE